jgi:hypothetical protein
MEQHRPPRRFRISTLMLLVLIAALSIALVMERRRRQVWEEMARANAARAEAEAAHARAIAQQAEYDRTLVEAMGEWERATTRAAGEAPGGAKGADQ